MMNPFQAAVPQASASFVHCLWAGFCQPALSVQRLVYGTALWRTLPATVALTITMQLLAIAWLSCISC